MPHTKGKYLSCIHLEQGLNIYKDHLTHCCIPHSDGKGNVEIGAFSGDQLPWELIQQAKQELIDQNQTEADTPCKGCPMLVSRSWKGDRRLKYVTINDFYTCNLKCCYCFTQTESGVEHMKLKRTHDTMALFTDAVSRGLLAPDAMIHWGGGEVAIYRHFEPVAGLLNQNGVAQFVNTNALVFSPVIEQGLKKRSMVVQVSVDAGTSETYAQVKGRDAFEVVFKNLARYAKAGDVQAKYIVMELNNRPEEVEGFMAACAQAGVGEIVVVPETGELVRRAISDQSLDAAAAMLATALKRGMVLNEDAFVWGEHYAPQVLARLAAPPHNLGKAALLKAKLRRYRKRAWRYLHSRGLGRRA